MDARAWVSLGVSFLLFGGVGLVFVFGARLLGFDSEAALEGWFQAAHGPWALPVAVAAFALLAFLGAPQFVLIAATVVAFGPVNGAIYSWVGTLVSALIGFALGRSAGARTLQMFAGESLDRFMALIGRNGFLASLRVWKKAVLTYVHSSEVCSKSLCLKQIWHNLCFFTHLRHSRAVLFKNAKQQVK